MLLVIRPNEYPLYSHTKLVVRGSRPSQPFGATKIGHGAPLVFF
jgi:hypothetical protein